MKRQFIVIAIALLLLGGGGAVVYNKTRGLRNNNPGNIRHGDRWQGMRIQQTDDDFVQFKAPKYGIRAMVKVLNSYRERHGITTVEGIIARWAPATENNTVSYINAVASRLGVRPEQHIDTRRTDVMRNLIEAIIHHENGLQPYSQATIDNGLQLAIA